VVKFTVFSLDEGHYFGVSNGFTVLTRMKNCFKFTTYPDLPGLTWILAGFSGVNASLKPRGLAGLRMGRRYLEPAEAVCWCY
jgi:hypothetical protein